MRSSVTNSVKGGPVSRWDDTERPILRAIYQIEQQADSPGKLDNARIADLAGVDYAQLILSLGYLANDRLIRAIDAATSEGPDYVVEGITGDGLRAIGEWPSNDQLAKIFPDVLNELAAQSEDEDRATILRRAGNVVEGIATTTLATLVKSLNGLD